MPIFLVLVAALTGGELHGQASDSSWNTHTQRNWLDDPEAIQLTAEELGHIADVIPPGQRAQSQPAEPPMSEPAPAPEPEPEPEPTPEPFADTLAEPALDPAAAPNPEPAAEQIAASDEGMTTPSMDKGWVVQIGAYEDRASAERNARRIGIEGIAIRTINRGGYDWYVLLLGSYPSYEEAQSSGATYAEETDGDYWVW